MSDDKPATAKTIDMAQGVPVVITLAAGARVGDIVSNLVFLPNGRTRKVNWTVTQDDIYAGLIIRLIPDLDPE